MRHNSRENASPWLGPGTELLATQTSGQPRPALVHERGEELMTPRPEHPAMVTSPGHVLRLPELPHLLLRLPEKASTLLRSSRLCKRERDSNRP